MNSDRTYTRAQLGVFSLGVSYALYSFMQYLFTPIAWEFAQRFGALGWMNDIFVFFTINGLEIFTRQSVIYSLVGLAAFAGGYLLLPAKLARINSPILERAWKPRSATRMFWVLFLTGFGLKFVRLLLGADISWVERISLFQNRYIAFFLSLNWLHFVALAVINIAYQEAKLRNAKLYRLRVLAFSVNTFILVASLTSGSRWGTAFPLCILLIIKQYYTPLSFQKIALSMPLLVIGLLTFKALLMTYLQGSSSDESNLARFALFYVFFYRINLSYILPPVIASGQATYPHGTLSQFWVDMLPWGVDRVNPFDGNEFGHAMGFVSSDDYVTGIAATNLGDLYINLGLVGIIVGMFLNGMIHKSIFSTCRTRRPGLVLLYALLWPYLLLGIQSPITALYSNAIKMAALCVIVHVAIVSTVARKSHTRASPSFA